MVLEEETKRALTDGQREKIKLRAAYINGIANALIVAGALTIPLSMAGQVLHPALGIPFAAACFVGSIRLHLWAQNVLDGLDQ